VLEIVHYGGLSPWETFWVNDNGEGDFFNVDHEGRRVRANMRGAEDLVRSFEWCRGGPDPDKVKYFDTDDGGNEIYWGPATAPLWTDEIMDSARMIVFGHSQNVHELALPIALTGQRIGKDTGAGLGAHISSVYSKVPGCSNQNRPHAYVLTPYDIGGYRSSMSSMLATGLHGGANRPVELRIGPDGLDNLFLDAEPDADSARAMEIMRDQYGQRLNWRGVDPVRSPQFDDYRSSVATLANSSALHLLVGGEILKSEDGSTCQADPTTGNDITTKALDVAALLLDPARGNARYVGVMDRGFDTYAGAPYDTHGDPSNADAHVNMTLGNLYNCLSHLSALIRSGAIDLDDTMVVLTTEMGRTPGLGDLDGRNHWTYATVQVLLGSPGERGIVGTINARGHAEAAAIDLGDRSFRSAHARAGILAAAGVNPVAPDSSTFVLGDLQDPLASRTDDNMAQEVGRRILGV
jgi:hypothetical protein